MADSGLRAALMETIGGLMSTDQVVYYCWSNTTDNLQKSTPGGAKQSRGAGEGARSDR